MHGRRTTDVVENQAATGQGKKPGHLMTGNQHQERKQSRKHPPIGKPPQSKAEQGQKQIEQPHIPHVDPKVVKGSIGQAAYPTETLILYPKQLFQHACPPHLPNRERGKQQ